MERRISRAWYGASVESFGNTPTKAVLGELASNGTFALEEAQRDAWVAEVDFLRERLRGISGWVFFEFNIPRMGRRVDVVLLTSGIVFVIEFKVGASTVDPSSVDQAWDYALDIKNFHEASHNLTIVPILIATDARNMARNEPIRDSDGVVRPLVANSASFRDELERAVAQFAGPEIDVDRWAGAPYRPTPNIVEAARALYAQHSVEAIARHDAGAENLRLTSVHLEQLIDEAKKTKRKLVCFVTGVPGAGKTLVGLNVATRRTEADASSPAVYLSGNAPLVAVLREALTRDEVARRNSLGERVRKGNVASSVKAFIQNVHHFRDDAIRDSGPPAEHVAIFDEAQRAWTLEETANFMRRKKGIADFQQSEPDFLLSYLDRHAKWGVVVCLVGGGQEINRGEAGIDSWLSAVNDHFPDWEMHISSNLTDSEYGAGQALDIVRNRPNTSFDDCLHLAVSMRSFRAENVSTFVKAVLDRERATARGALEEMAGRYPLAVTRDLDAAKDWVRQNARGSERYGLVASSKAQRLKPHAIDIRVDVNPVHWFLNGKDDTRSSYYLEDAATEFQVQGLELDWTCVTWDADLRLRDRGWGFHDFRGSRWTNVNNTDNQRYLLNSYRVLLTRARQGMVIFVPPGKRSDPTRSPEFYDATFEYLKDVGMTEIG